MAKRPIYIIKDELLEAETRFQSLLDDLIDRFEDREVLRDAMRDIANLTGEMWSSAEYARERDRIDFALWAGEELGRGRDRRMLDRCIHWASNIVAHRISLGDPCDIAEVVSACWKNVQELEVAFSQLLTSKREEL